MRLWVKITAICTIVLVFIITISFGVVLQLQKNSLHQSEEDNARKNLVLYCTNIISASTASGSNLRQTTMRSVVQYYFANYASLAETGQTFYSLVSDGKYLFDRSPYDPYSLFPSVQNEEASDNLDESSVQLKRTQKGEDTVLVGKIPFLISNQEFEAYISVDISETERQIATLQIVSAVLLGIACVMTAFIVIFLVRRTLSPIEKLTKNAVCISNGQYHLRTNYKGKDEIGTLSVTFDKMADSIEEKITSLDQELQKQQLLLGALSHEMKTPMTALMGYADSLLRMPLSERQKMECARKIYHAGSLMESLTQKMMALVGMSDTEQIEKTEIDCADFVEELRELIPPQVVVCCEVDRIFGDEALLLSMVLNLVENALRASGDTPQVTVKITKKDGFTQIIVSDKGCGIAEDQIPLITEPFYRVDKARSRKHGGAGLGLAICKKICECHGGTLSITSKIGEGTTVTAALMTNR